MTEGSGFIWEIESFLVRKIKFYGGDSSHEPEESSRSSLWYISAILWPKYWTAHKVLRRARPCHPAVLNRSFVITLLLMQPEYSGLFSLSCFKDKHWDTIIFIRVSAPAAHTYLFIYLFSYGSQLGVHLLVHLYLQIMSARGQCLQIV